jgi:hypothetical protein
MENKTHETQLRTFWSQLALPTMTDKNQKGDCNTEML